MMGVLQSMVDNLWTGAANKDRKGQKPSGIKLTAVSRNENVQLWCDYSKKRKELSKQCRQKGHRLPESLQRNACRTAEYFKTANLQKFAGKLDKSANEFYLFHGTSDAGVQGILEHGFDIDMAGTNAGNAFGNGAYFAERPCKSDAYVSCDDTSIVAKDVYVMLVCRVACGGIKMVKEFDSEAHTRMDGYTCLLGDREAAARTYREYIVYDKDQVYPEFAMRYEREYRPWYKRWYKRR